MDSTQQAGHMDSSHASSSQQPELQPQQPHQPQPQPQQPAEASSSSAATAGSAKPVVIIVIGMAGSGKTTLIQRLQSYLHSQQTPPYIINIDPAVTHMPYSPNIDIRDTVKYKDVMKQYNLGPNGGILTSCNLFATRFDQVIQLLEKPRTPPLQHVLLDTPGQIEIFTWSASGQIITELLASSFPTVVAYVMDTPRCLAPQTFMSNMLQAVSILYKTQLPLLLVFNKTDVARHEFALEWMADFEAYQAALERDATYAATLSRSLALVLDEFYANLRTVGVSALTGEGMPEFFQAVQGAAQEYHQYYVPELEARRKEKEAREERAKQKQMAAVRRDLAATQLADSSQPQAGGPGGSGTALQHGRASQREGAGPAGGTTQQQQQQQEAEEQEAEEQEEEEEGCDYALSDESIEADDGVADDDMSTDGHRAK